MTIEFGESVFRFANEVGLPAFLLVIFSWFTHSFFFGGRDD